MGQYYYLVTGLPEISLDDSKLSFSVADFKKVIYPQLTLLDKKVADLFFLRFCQALGIRPCLGKTSL